MKWTAAKLAATLIDRAPLLRRLLVAVPISLFLYAMAEAGSPKGMGPADCPACAYCQVRPEDQVWLISTRPLGNQTDCPACCPQLRYCRYDRSHGWVSSTADEFLAGDSPEVITTVYVHGNRMSDQWVEDRGFKTYCGFTCGDSSPPIRHVIWSWPSQPIPRRCAVVRDARVKSRRTAVQSYYLGWWLSQLQPDIRVSLVGYSYGGRTILGAVHMLAGGKLCGRCLPAAPHGDTVCPRVVVMATAAQADWILPGNCYGRFTEKLDRGLVFYNCDDPVLKRYNRLIPGSTGPALGHVGVVCGNRLGSHCHRLMQFDATCHVGPQHRFDSYYECPKIWGLVRQYALWECVD